MKSGPRLLTLLLVAFGAGLALWRPWGAANPVGPEAPSFPERGAGAVAGLARAGDAPETQDPASPPAMRGELASPPEEGPSKAAVEEAWPRGQVRGRVVARGSGLPGALVKFWSMTDHWIDDPAFEGHVGATKTITDEDGRFEFDVALPTSPWVMLTVDHLPYHMRAERSFRFGSEEEPPLVPGDNELGEFLLEPAGAIRGQVRHLGTDTPPETRVFVEWGGTSKSDWPDEEGRYELGGVPPGRHSVEVHSEGFVSATRDSVEVRAGVTAERVDFTLERARAISGRVVDEDSMPVVGAKVWGGRRTPNEQWKDGVRVTSQPVTRSAEDGTFELFFDEDGEHWLSASLEAQHEPLIGESGPYYERGATEVVLVLPRSTPGRFRVLDARDGEPVERYGLNVFQARGFEGGTYTSDLVPASLGDHAGGLAILHADPRWHDVTLIAPGYGDLRTRVAWDGEGEKVMTLRLEPEGVLRGRTVSGGAPASQVRIELMADEVALVPGASADDPMAELLGHWGRDLDAFAGRVRQVVGAADGSFEVAGLAAGTYELKVSASGSSPRIVEGIAITAGEALDLGTIQLD